MTKKDAKAVAMGAGLGLGAFLILYFFGRKTQPLPELAPTQVKWSDNG